MFLIDDLFLAPFRGIKFVAEAVHDAARDHIENERQALRDELNDLYMRFDTGEITEEEFEQREDEILDRLEVLDETETELEDGGADEPQASEDGEEDDEEQGRASQ